METRSAIAKLRSSIVPRIIALYSDADDLLNHDFRKIESILHLDK